MVVIILELVPSSLRGELSKWFIEPQVGVFIGKVSALVREKVWAKCQEESRGGRGSLVYSYNNEQGYEIVSFGDSRRQIVDFEGLFLIRMNNKT